MFLTNREIEGLAQEFFEKERTEIYLIGDMKSKSVFNI